MKRAEYNDYLYIRSKAREYTKEGCQPNMWHIRNTYSPEFKQKVDKLIRETGFFPCRVGEPFSCRGDGDHIIYIRYESEAQWMLLTTDWEREQVATALRT